MGIANSMIQGVGVNDADYTVRTCPFYRCWKRMLARCYSANTQSRQPTYAECKVCDEWHRLTVFKSWMETQEWDGRQLDKDLIGDGKLYSPANCVFLTPAINALFIDCGSARGNLPIGVSLHKRSGRFAANINMNGRKKHLGHFTSPDEAHSAWFRAKLEISQNYLENEQNPRVRYAIQCGIDKLKAKYAVSALT